MAEVAKRAWPDARDEKPYPLRSVALETSVGASFVYLVWALKPNEPRIIAICTSAEKAGKYADNLPRSMVGLKTYVERAPLDHSFGFKDLQSFIYRDGHDR